MTDTKCMATHPFPPDRLPGDEPELGQDDADDKISQDKAQEILRALGEAELEANAPEPDADLEPGAPEPDLDADLDLGPGPT